MIEITNRNIIFSFKRNKGADILYETAEELKTAYRNIKEKHYRELKWIQENAEKDFLRGFVRSREFTEEVPHFVMVTKNDFFEKKPPKKK